MACPSDFTTAHEVAETLRHFATKSHHEPMESAMREAADLIERFADRINHLTNVNDGLRETLETQRDGLAELKAMLVAEKPA